MLYIGRATALRSRVSSYWGDLGDRPHLARMVRAVTRIEAVACDSMHEAAWLERNLLEERLPRWNRTAGGQETPSWMLLDPSPRSPGLRLIHTPPPELLPGGRGRPATEADRRLFGPYLGGNRTRLALSALHRLHPLAYAGESLTGAEREMAAKRGVHPSDSPALAAALAAILSRTPEAVAAARTGLEQLRDQASAELAFERAGVLQSELAALDWVTAPQRATTATRHEATVHGWADGLLSTFTIRGGRLCEWSQRPCSATTAKPRLADTPPEWRPFAQRNATLAAALRS